MTRNHSIIILLAVIPLFLGMGSLQGTSSPDKIPIPAKKYHAIFVDQADVITECREASIEGATFLEGKRGEGNFTISFENIEQVLFRQNEEQLTGIVKLHGGEVLELSLNKNQKGYGLTKYGTFQIKLSDLKKMTFEPSPKR